MLAAAECSRDVSATCPTSLTLKTIVKYTTMVFFYCCVAIALFHSFMESYRLKGRGNLVLCMEDKNQTAMVFQAMDKDGDDKIARVELVSYLNVNDIDDAVFLRSFDNLVSSMCSIGTSTASE